MKISPSRLGVAVIGFLSGAGVAQAHPGHDGHELTWDFGHLAQHPFATMGCAAVVGAGVAVLLQVLRRRAEQRDQSLRVSQRSRGK